MAKDFKVALLLDFYGQMLTEKQRDVIDLYYNEDLSLGEIAEHVHITRQGVRDSIKRGEQQLLEWEDTLGLAGKFVRCAEMMEEIRGLAQGIYDETTMYNFPRTISDRAQKILGHIGAFEELQES